jgi:hypothetical protein
MPAIKSHSTPVDKTGAWDGPKAVADAPNDPKVLHYMHAWEAAKADLSKKGSYKFPHHAGKMGSAANIAGCNNVLARLSQADIPSADDAGVEAHARKHRKDAGLDEAMSPTEIQEAVRRIKKLDDLNAKEALELKEYIMAQEGRWIRLHESATDKNRIRAALRAMKELLKDRDVPDDIHEKIEALCQAMNKKWDDLGDDAHGEDAQESLRWKLREAINENMSADDLVRYAQGEMWDIITAAQALIQMAQLRSECDEPDDIAVVADIMTGICKFILGEIVEMVSAAQSAGAQGEEPDEETDDNSTTDDATEVPMGEGRRDLGGEVELIESAVALSEKAVRGDGTATLKIIQPGWGSSGYYAPEVLKRDGPKAFPAGTKMLWNHPTDTQESERPEGDLNDLASELVTPARWQDNGPAGAGLYADAKIFKGYQESVNDLAPHIGVSIHARGKAMQGEMEGKKGNIVQEISESPFNRVDYVTMPGAGGKVISLFEAARIKSRVGVQPIVSAVNATNVANLLATHVAKVGESAMNAHRLMEEKMADEKLQEAVATLQADNARLAERLALRDAKDTVREVLAGYQLPEATKDRLTESLTKSAPMKEGKLDADAFGKMITEAIKVETEYLTKTLGLGTIRGLGEGLNGEVDEKAVDESLKESFATLTGSDTLGEKAAKGRK